MSLILIWLTSWLEHSHVTWVFTGFTRSLRVSDSLVTTLNMLIQTFSVTEYRCRESWSYILNSVLISREIMWEVLGRPRLAAPAGQSTKRLPDMAPTPSDNRALSSLGGGQNFVHRFRRVPDDGSGSLLPGPCPRYPHSRDMRWMLGDLD